MAFSRFCNTDKKLTALWGYPRTVLRLIALP